VRDAARELRDYAERRARAALGRLHVAGAAAADWLEGDGLTDRDLPITVRVDVRDGALLADFTGTAGAVPGNVNCPMAVTRSAVLFVVRMLLPDDIPMNGGVQRVVGVHAPAGCLVNASWPSAVAAGNVETSQRIADVVQLALAGAGAVPAQGQGTMNNVTFGGAGWTYYETIGGGQGASAAGPGPSGVHVGMSNTRNTPIEVVELECPLRVRRYALKRGSGGVGTWEGGEGVIREFVALGDAQVSLLTERRRHRPRGAAGGGDGAAGRNLLNGKPLGSKTQVRVHNGDVLTIETPGGGGYGMPERRRGEKRRGKASRK
jgi:N-methylhydantoinase B